MLVHPPLPFDEVVNDFVRLLASASMNHAGSRVKDFFDFIIFIVIDQVRRWQRWGFLIRECQRDVQCQELLVEARMNLPMRRELQLVGSGSCFVKNREGADVLVIELLLGLREVKVSSV